MSKEKSENNITQHVGDVNAKTIFGNPVLCLQFLKDNINIPLFKNLTPNDIEDVTERFTSYFGIEYEADTIKKLRIRSEDEEFDMYVVSLIDHKSYVDYNVSIQLLKYMACIWAEYEKEIMRNENESETEGLGRKNITRNKNFRYPPILLVRSLCERVNATDEEKDECVRKVVGRQMGYLFENMEKMDIQAERQKTQEQKERADKAETQAGILQTQLEVFKMAKKEKSVEEIAKTLKIEVDEVHKILES